MSSDNRLIFFGFLGQNLRSEISAKSVDLFVFFLPTDPTFLFKYAQHKNLVADLVAFLRRYLFKAFVPLCWFTNIRLIAVIIRNILSCSIIIFIWHHTRFCTVWIMCAIFFRACKSLTSMGTLFRIFADTSKLLGELHKYEVILSY